MQDNTSLQKRIELQAQALEKLKNYRRLVLNWGTGVGKSRVAVMAMHKILEQYPDAHFLLMVQETAHKDNWIKEFKDTLENNADFVLQHVTIDCYASLSKHKNTSWEMIVFDEAHHLRSALRQDIVMTMKADRVLMLTATISERNDGEDMLWTMTHTFGPFEFLTFGLQDAINEKILYEPEIHIVPVHLSDSYWNKYEKQSDYLEKAKTEYFRSKKMYGLDFDDPDIDETIPLKTQWLNAGSRRKIILGNAKTYAAKKILAGPLKDKKLICFCSSVDQIDWLGGTNHVSGRQTPKMNKEAISSFNEGRQNRLFAMGMLQEGQNLTGIEAGLIIQLDGKARSFIQKFGRVMRSRVPVLYILVGVDTHDLEYLDNALKDIDPKYIIYEEPIGAKLNQYETINAPQADCSISQWILDYKNGCLINNDGEVRRELTGVVKDIEVTNNAYVFKIQNNTTINAFPVRKLLSVSLVASLCELISVKNHDQTIKVNTLVTERGYPSFELYGSSGRKYKWSKSFLERYRNLNGDKTQFLDDIINEINQIFIP